MKLNTKKALSLAATGERASRDYATVSVFNQKNSITKGSTAQAPLLIFLSAGEQNAIPAVQLCEMLGLRDTRTLRFAVERERAAGTIILSSDKGYFMPATDEKQAIRELEAFCRRSDARLRSNRNSVRAARAALKKLTAGEISGQVVLPEWTDALPAWTGGDSTGEQS